MKKYLGMISAAVFAVITFTGCLTTTTTAGAVGADRHQLMLVSESQMEESSKANYAQVISEAKAKGVLNNNAATLKRVQTIAANLIEQTGNFRKDALKWNWQVNVITDSTVNAWCMPGGRIVVYTGIIDSLKLTDAQLAAVMGHEISHALREHSREQVSRAYMTEMGVGAVSILTGAGDSGTALLSAAAQLGLTLPFSRSHETEADNMGTELMARAGYDPYEAVNVWKKMASLGSSGPEIMSTHPSNESRIKNLTEVSKKVYPLYQLSNKR